MLIIVNILATVELESSKAGVLKNSKRRNFLTKPFINYKEMQFYEKSIMSLRAGETSKTEEPALFTLFVQIFKPSYKSIVSKKKLDPRRKGIVERIKIFCRSLFKIDNQKGKVNGGTKEKEVIKNQHHFNQKFKPGNVNYRIQKELKEFMKSPPPNCAVSVSKNIRVWIVTITGAENTLYAGEKYKLRVSFPNEYPSKPPICYFLKPTPKHTHCYSNGDICLNLLGKDWRPSMTVSSLALAILSMLSSAKTKSLPLDNAAHADSPPGKVPQENFIYHDDNC